MSGPTCSLVLQETADVFGAFPKLTDEQVESLKVEGKATARGEVLFREGDLTCDFFVILSGLVAIVDGYGREDRVISVHGPGRFLGELGLLTGEAVFTTAVVQEPGEVLAIPPPTRARDRRAGSHTGRPDPPCLPDPALHTCRPRGRAEDRGIPVLAGRPSAT